MIGSFKNYLVEEEREVFFTFGRMNPPTIGHQKLLDKLASVAGRMPYFVYLSQSQDPKKNPLDYKTKVKTVRKMFPRHARSVILERSCKNAMECAVKLYDQGYKNITMVVGQDRVREFDVLLKKYNGQKARHGFYNFNGINVISAGNRDPDAEGAEGMSASKMRSAASDNDFTTFAQGLPKGFSNAESKKLFNAVRSGMGLKETKEFTKHIQLEPVSEIRESYIRDRIFEEGETVVLPKKGSIVGKIMHLGSNYLIVESKGEVHRCWLDDVNKLDPTNYVPHWDQAPFPDYPKPELGLREATDRWYKDQPEWGTPEATKKAKQITPGQNTESSHPNIWDNIRKRRAKGLPPRKPGEKGYPKTLDLPEENPCWDGFKQVGTKTKNGKQVPNCVPEKIEVPQDKDIDDKKGSQPATFHKGIKSKSTKSARDAHFKKMSKRDDHKNPDLYKDAPGDKAARKKGTKPSPYTLRFKQMYGEDAVARAKARIDREKKSDAARHDNMMDRARLQKARRINRETRPKT